MNDRFEKFDDQARLVLSLAQEEAQRFNHNYIGTEHLLLGLVRQSDSLAVRILRAQGIEPNKVRAQVEFIIGRGEHIVQGEIGLTPRAKKVIELAVDESRRLNHHYMGTEHLLLGMLREGEGIAARVLASFGLQLDTVRTAVAVAVATRSAPTARENVYSAEAPQPGATPAGGPKTNVVACRLDDATLDAIDALVEAGIRNTRSDAAAWLIGAGIEAHRPLFERVNATVNEIRRLRVEAQTIAQQVRQEAASGVSDESAAPAESADTPTDTSTDPPVAPRDAPDAAEDTPPSDAPTDAPPPDA